jgi:protein-S-isoprenylcysteine O-methyltransferase Ste14
MKKLILQTIRTALIGILLMGLVLFLPAGTLNYWQAWVFIAVFSISTNAIGIYLARKDPLLLERRVNFGPAKEPGKAQKIIMSLTGVGVLAMLVFPALDHRFGWSPVPTAVSLVGDFLVALGLYIDLLVMKVNSFSGSTVQTFEGQQVISTGPYGVVRHPMYSGVLIMCAGVPLALGSWWGLWILVIVLPVLAWRILDEEKLLSKELPGYTEYMGKVRFHLVPYLW